MNAADDVELKVRNDLRSNTTSSCYSYQENNIDDIKLHLLPNSGPSVIYSTDGNWSYNDEFDNLGWSLEYDNAYDHVVDGNDEYVRLTSSGSNSSYNPWLQSPEFTVAKSGLLQFDWSEFIEGQYYRWRPRVQASINGAGYFDIYYRDLEYCENYILSDYNSWNDRTGTIGEVLEGDLVHIRFKPYNDQGNGNNMAYRFKDLNLFTTNDQTDSYIGSEHIDFFNAGDMTLTNCVVGDFIDVEADSTSKINLHSTVLLLNGNSLDHLDIQAPSAIITSTIANKLVLSADSVDFVNNTISDITLECGVSEIRSLECANISGSARFVSLHRASWIDRY